jgi:branched-chain amino acid transport system substrate-binding protein
MTGIMPKRVYFIGLALASASTLAITACSSSTSSGSTPSSPASSSSSSSPAAAAAASGTAGAPLVFGVIASDSGPTGTTSDVPTTASDWASYVNAHGGIAGHPVQVVVENDGDSAATALQDAQDLIQNKHAIAIGDASFTDTAFEKYVDSAKVPVISLTQGDATFTYVTDPNFFSNEATVPVGIWAQSKVAQLSGATKYGFMYCSEVAACAQSIPLEKADAASVGISLAYTGSFSASAPNYTAQCLTAKQDGVQALFVAGANTASNQRVLDDCASQSYKPTAVAAVGTLGTATAKDPQIPVQWGYTGTLPWFVKNSATTTFDQVMGGYLPSATTPATVMGTWTGLQLFAAAAAHVGATPTAQDIYTGLYALDGNNLGGLTSPLTFKSGQPHPVNCVFVYEIKNGSYSTPEGTAPVCTTKAAM